MYRAERRSLRRSDGSLSFGLLIALLFVAAAMTSMMTPLSLAIGAFRECFWEFRLAITLKSIYLSDFEEVEINGLKIEKSSRSVFSDKTEIEIIHYHITEENNSFDFEKVGKITNIS